MRSFSLGPENTTVVAAGTAVVAAATVVVWVVTAGWDTGVVPVHPAKQAENISSAITTAPNPTCPFLS